MIQYKVIDTDGHCFPIGAVVTKAANLNRIFSKATPLAQDVFEDVEGLQQSLFPHQVKEIPRSLLDTLLGVPLPSSLACHFKSCSNIRELFEIPSSGYVLQCIDQVTLSPLERVTLRALFEAYLLEIA